MSRLPPFALGVGAAAGLAAVAWFLRIGPELTAARQASLDAADSVRAARRDASDRAMEAASERARNGELEERIKELERTLTARVPTRGPTAAPDSPDKSDTTGMGGGQGHHGGGAGVPAEPPEKWDLTVLSHELEVVAASGAAIPQHPRLPLLVRGFRSQKDVGITLLRQIVKDTTMPSTWVVIAALVGGELDDRRLVEPYFTRWREEKDPDVRYAVFKALAALPGDEIVPGLMAAWIDPATPRPSRIVAIEGLGRRGIDLAREAAMGTAGGATLPPGVPSEPAFRMRAMIGLRDFAETGKWTDATLPLIFGKCLRTADGEPQRRLAITALEGFWNAAAAKELAEYAADGSSAPALAVRAKTAADAIQAGKARPADAGRIDGGLRKAE